VPEQKAAMDATGSPEHHDHPEEENAAVIPAVAIHLGRQPILDREGTLCGFELLFRNDSVNRADVVDADAATAQVLTHAIGHIGVRAALAGHKGYLNASRALLVDEAIKLVPPDQFVFELPPDIEVDDALIERIRVLHAQRYRFVLDDVVQLNETFARLLPYVESIKINFTRCSHELLPKLVRTLKSAGKILIALKVERQEEFELARSLGFDLFQGYFFARPQMLSVRRASAPRQALLNLLQLLASDPSVMQLESELKLNPVLVMHLMRLANSGAMGLLRKVTTLRDAINATGTNRIARWTQLLLYADGHKAALEDDPLVQLVATRARFMELAVERLAEADRTTVDAAFLTGVFSLVDVVFGDSLERTLEDLTLSPAIRAAILRREGVLGALLSTVVALEQANWAAVEVCCGLLPPLTVGEVAELGLTAAGWAGMENRSAEAEGLERIDD
jgi:c-di-GMP-related signal transduction protein